MNDTQISQNLLDILKSKSVYYALECIRHEVRSHFVFLKDMSRIIIDILNSEELAVISQNILRKLFIDSQTFIDEYFAEAIDNILAASDYSKEVTDKEKRVSTKHIADLVDSIDDMIQQIPTLEQEIEALIARSESVSADFATLFVAAQTHMRRLFSELEAVKELLLPRMANFYYGNGS